MKRLVSLLLVVCMLLSSFALAEDVLTDSVIPDANGDVILGEELGDDLLVDPDEPVQAPVDEEDLIINVEDDLTITPSTEVDGPDPYRELILLTPTDVTGSTVAEDHIRVSWGPVAFATYYEVYRKLGGESDYTMIKNVPSNQCYYDDTDIAPGQVVYYRIKAWNISYSDDLTPVTVSSDFSKTLPYITLAAPKLADPRGDQNTSIYLSWTFDEAATSYEVQMSESANGTFSPVRTNLKDSSVEILDLTNKQGYYFRVRSVRVFSSGERFFSEWSNIGCGTPMGQPTLTVQQNGKSAVLTWSASDGAKNYIIYRKAGDGAYTLLAKTGAVTTYVDNTIEMGQVYYYFIYASRPVGAYNCFSLSSDHISFIALDAVTITAVRNTGSQEQTIDWAAPVAGANKYYVYSSTTMNGLYSKIGETEGTTFVATGLTKGATYYYKVRAVRVFNNGFISQGPWSNIMSQPESGILTLDSVSAMNATVGKDISGGYVGDVFTWSTKVFGGSGQYTFRYSLVSLDGAGSMVLQEFSDGYQAIPEGASSLTASFALTLTSDMVALINTQRYAMQVEVRDSLGASAIMPACPATYDEMNFVAPAPTSKQVTKTIRAGESFDLEHGIYAECGDSPRIELANANGAVSVSGTKVTGVNNGYATFLIIPERFPDALIVYYVTVAYAPLTITEVKPSATQINTYDTLAWDIVFSGGRAPYTVNYKVYNGTVLAAEYTRTESAAGVLSANYQPMEKGNYLLEVTITTMDKQSVTMRSPVTVVKAYNPVTVVPNTVASATGTPITWAVSYSGSNSVYRRDYTLFRDGVVVATSVGSNDVAFTFTPGVAGSYVLRVIAYESNGNRIEVNSAPVTVVLGDGTTGSTGTGVVNGVRVALRRGAGTNYGRIIRVDKGQTVIILGSKESSSGDLWYNVNYNGTVGWMMARYITRK